MRWMMNIVAALFILLALPALPAMAQEGFLSAAPDVPLMEALEELAASSIIFDKPGGRIIDVVLAGDVTEPEVKSYYAETLMALGWQEVPPVPQSLTPLADHPSLAFANEWERLTLTFEDRHKGALHIRVTITPLNTPSDVTH